MVAASTARRSTPVTMAADDATDQMLKHRTGQVVIDAVAVANKANGARFAATADHLGGGSSHRQDACPLLVGRHHGRLVDDDTLAFDVHEDGRGAQVDADLF